MSPYELIVWEHGTESVRIPFNPENPTMNVTIKAHGLKRAWRVLRGKDVVSVQIVLNIEGHSQVAGRGVS